ncbi:MAG: hypothetical protein ACE37I_09800 [Rubinisphaera brasiliensis]|uniref:Uncharacterized protein n=1 Tax=Rubinisphaera brasiliensis (strain ATCC 49424 / DSM 5305 / JCM 21570 / IAM 15109 / NBRC 103401 / IFAM 1448) TaxID=756272 RepID=F0SN20_RUBBR|nr:MULTISPECIES: hypothetical protein [Rubinisphaera]ADY61049.1 hypothetical protein Plabr_3452 [Rubinisphaera brasiliensis DSM 5305]
MRTRLRLYTGEDQVAVCEEETVRVRFGDICQILADAGRFQRAWLKDFADDELQMPADLYEILTAYQQLRPGA